MGAVLRIVAHRLRLRWPALVVTGLLIGLGFGMSMAALAAARTTASAYGRVLAAADTEDATISHLFLPDQAERQFGSIDGVERVRTAVGFLGFFEGVDLGLTLGILAPAGTDEFPFERPQMREGRLPNQDALDEIFVNDVVADAAGLLVGDEVVLHVFERDFANSVPTRMTVVGIGTLPRQLLTDETEVLALVSPTRAFAEANDPRVIYAESMIHTRDGIDVGRDLAPAISEAGGELQEVRAENSAAVNRSQRPLLAVILALAAIVLVAGFTAAWQLIQRERERWRSADVTSQATGLVRGQVVLVHLGSAAVYTPIAALTSFAFMVAASPLAPVGPLHDFDPAQGLTIDWTVGLLGVAAVVLTCLGLTVALAARPPRRRAARPRRSRLASFAAQRPSAAAGLSLAFSGRGNRSGRRVAASAAAAAALCAFMSTLVASADSLVDSPSRYGFDWDLMAVNQYGDQDLDAIDSMFVEPAESTAVTGFSMRILLIEGVSVPALGARSLEGDLWPTILRGDAPRLPDEIVLGRDTLADVGADVGDVVQVRGIDPETGEQTDALPMRIVGVSTFPNVAQPGFDQARLGVGALMTFDAFLDLEWPAEDLPEWTAVRLRPGVDPETIIARHPDGVPDRFQIPTLWFTDAKPAEVIQLDSVLSLLLGASTIGSLVATAVFVHGLSSQARASRREYAILNSIGFTRRRDLVATAAWQTLPAALVASAVGIAAGVIVGRLAFSAFARTMDVVDTASSPPLVVLAIVAVVVVATSIGFVVASSVARRVRPALLLRAQ